MHIIENVIQSWLNIFAPVSRTAPIINMAKQHWMLGMTHQSKSLTSTLKPIFWEKLEHQFLKFISFDSNHFPYNNLLLCELIQIQQLFFFFNLEYKSNVRSRFDTGAEKGQFHP